MNKHTFNGLISGLSATSLLYSNFKYPEFTPARSDKNQDLDNMRGDWLKIGGDFKTAIQREKSAQEKARHS
ncbi:hypothetical protein [Methylomonas rapida]|uniref:Uncharacterized protein n=1 Tax=Methylomonas rapida TaxID=2963939 RepID=A0ABY7GEN0_9GAMM|nr:hypothetical protein [Methylomonas rapida]WAR43740.1 hypothetical protein NM686_015315 [Methylomonas rapida]